MKTLQQALKEVLTQKPLCTEEMMAEFERFLDENDYNKSAPKDYGIREE